MRVVVTGAAGVVGRRVVTQLHRDHPQVDVVAVDRNDLKWLPTSVMATQVDLETADLCALFSNANTVVHLASTVNASSVNGTDAERELALFHRVLDALAKAGVAHLVMVSSAIVYGARVDNPVPMTEEAPVRPNTDFGWAVQRYQLEQLAQQWATGLPSDQRRAVSVLRPTAVMADDRPGNLALALQATRSGVAANGDPPVQYLHIDDLASAVVAVVCARYDGVVNVAPDGWIPPNGMANLEGFRPRLRVSPLVAKTVNTLRFQWGAPTPPGAVSYTVYPWVVANDRLKELGWTSTHSNEEAWIMAHKPRWWESLSPIRRQEVLLAIAGTTTLSVIALMVWVVLRMRWRR